MKSVLKTLSSPLFLVASCIFLVNRWSEFYGIYIPFVNSYLDDLMLMPIVLTMALAGMRFIIFLPFELVANKPEHANLFCFLRIFHPTI